MRRPLLGQGRLRCVKAEHSPVTAGIHSRDGCRSPACRGPAWNGSDRGTVVTACVDEGERRGCVLAGAADSKGRDHEQEKEHGAGDQQAHSPASLLGDSFRGVEGRCPGATFGGVVGEGFVGIDADGMGDGSDEAASVDFAGEVVVAALFEALELGEGDASGPGESIDGQSALDPGPS